MQSTAERSAARVWQRADSVPEIQAKSTQQPMGYWRLVRFHAVLFSHLWLIDRESLTLSLIFAVLLIDCRTDDTDQLILILETILEHKVSLILARQQGTF